MPRTRRSREPRAARLGPGVGSWLTELRPSRGAAQGARGRPPGALRARARSRRPRRRSRAGVRPTARASQSAPEGNALCAPSARQPGAPGHVGPRVTPPDRTAGARAPLGSPRGVRRRRGRAGRPGRARHGGPAPRHRPSARRATRPARAAPTASPLRTGSAPREAPRTRRAQGLAAGASRHRAVCSARPQLDRALKHEERLDPALAFTSSPGRRASSSAANGASGPRPSALATRSSTGASAAPSIARSARAGGPRSAARVGAGSPASLPRARRRVSRRRPARARPWRPARRAAHVGDPPSAVARAAARRERDHGASRRRRAPVRPGSAGARARLGKERVERALVLARADRRVGPARAGSQAAASRPPRARASDPSIPPMATRLGDRARRVCGVASDEEHPREGAASGGRCREGILLPPERLDRRHDGAAQVRLPPGRRRGGSFIDANGALHPLTASRSPASAVAPADPPRGPRRPSERLRVPRAPREPAPAAAGRAAPRGSLSLSRASRRIEHAQVAERRHSLRGAPRAARSAGSVTTRTPRTASAARADRQSTPRGAIVAGRRQRRHPGRAHQGRGWVKSRAPRGAAASARRRPIARSRAAPRSRPGDGPGRRQRDRGLVAGRALTARESAWAASSAAGSAVDDPQSRGARRADRSRARGRGALQRAPLRRRRRLGASPRTVTSIARVSDRAEDRRPARAGRSSRCRTTRRRALEQRERLGAFAWPPAARGRGGAPGAAGAVRSATSREPDSRARGARRLGGPRPATTVWRGLRRRRAVAGAERRTHGDEHDGRDGRSRAHLLSGLATSTTKATPDGAPGCCFTASHPTASAAAGLCAKLPK